MDEPISEKVEKSLDKPLLPKKFQPIAPPRKRRGRKIQEILRKFDPISRENIRNVTNYQNEILDLYDNTEHEGKEGDVSSAGASFEALKEILHPILWQKYERKLTHLSTPDIFFHISCAILKTVR